MVSSFYIHLEAFRIIRLVKKALQNICVNLYCLTVCPFIVHAGGIKIEITKFIQAIVKMIAHGTVYEYLEHAEKIKKL